MPDDLLREKEGTYVSGKMRLRFYVQDGALHVINPSGDDFVLLPESGDTFFENLFDTGFRFLKDNEGRVIKVITRERGAEMEWQKEK